MAGRQDVRRLLALEAADRRGMLTPTQQMALRTLEERMRDRDPLEGVKAAGQTAASIASSAIAEPVSGLVGLAALPFGADVSARAIERTQEGMTYQPTSERSQGQMQDIGQAMQPVGEMFSGISQYAGDAAFEATGSPAAAAAAYSAPTAALELLGLNIARRLPTGKQYQMGDIGAKGPGARQMGAVGGVKSATEPDLTYRMDHRPMTVDQGAATAENLVDAFGEDIYGRNALQFFGSGDPREARVVSKLKAIRGNPNAKVKIYRGAPEGAEILPGDWVTLSKEAAQDYADQVNGVVKEMEVPAKDVTVWADSLLEQGYYPSK